MKIGIFGHSRAIYKKRSYVHYSERVNTHFPEYQINWYGATTSSIERLVYSIQKHSSDLYIIMHNVSYCVYCPDWPRDFPADELFKKSRRDQLLKDCERENIAVNTEELDAYKKFYNNREDLNYIAYLLLMKGLLVDKNIIHVSMYGQQEKRIFKGDYFSEKIATELSKTITKKNEDSRHEAISKAIIHEIESKVKT